MRRAIAAVGVAVTVLLAGGSVATADPPQGMLFHDGDIVRTFAPPAAIPHDGIDPLYSVANGVEGQLSVTAVAPGDGPYHGGRWAVYTVTFDDGVSPYLLTSDEAVLAAEAAGDVTVVRTPEADNRCPVLA
jgi:hypothetical protein